MAIYIARIEGDPADAPVKIGYARNPAQRLENLQTGHYRTYLFMRVVDGSLKDETRIHAMFQHLRVRGEWFQFDPAMLGDLGLRDLPVPSPAPPRMRGRSMTDQHRTTIADAMRKSWAEGSLRSTHTRQRAA